jgi:SpoIIAA-like
MVASLSTHGETAAHSQQLWPAGKPLFTVFHAENPFREPVFGLFTGARDAAARASRQGSLLSERRIAAELQCRALIERVTDLPGGTLGFRASGKIGSDEYRQMIEPIYAALERGEKLNVYFELGSNFQGLDLGALWQDLRAAGSVGLKHRSSWQRMALVTDKDWVRHGASAFGWLAPGELRLFEPSERDEARAWLTQTSPS